MFLRKESAVSRKKYLLSSSFFNMVWGVTEIVVHQNDLYVRVPVFWGSHP
jgi:hypothetical protein